MRLMDLYCKTVKDKPELRELTKPFYYKGVSIPIGFQWDGASCPRVFWAIIPPFASTIKASCIHDFLCHTATCRVDRFVADNIFKDMLQEAKLNPARVYLGYAGVRLGAFLGIGNRF